MLRQNRNCGFYLVIIYRVPANNSLFKTEPIEKLEINKNTRDEHFSGVFDVT